MHILNYRCYRISYDENPESVRLVYGLVTTTIPTPFIPKPTTTKEKRNVIVLKEDGLIDTIKTRRDVFKDTWYDEFIQIQSALARYNNTSEETIY